MPDKGMLDISLGLYAIYLLVLNVTTYVNQLRYEYLPTYLIINT